MTGEETVKGRNLRRDPRVTLCVHGDAPPFRFVIAEGTVSADDPDMLRWSTLISGRYMGEDRAEAYGRRNAAPGELLVRLTLGKVISQTNVAD